MVDVNTLKSHPEKPLFKHVKGVIENTEKVTKGLKISKWAELVAIFHDLGKINPNFQRKVDPNCAKKDLAVESENYSSHAYFSAYIFSCISLFNPDIISNWLNVEELSHNDILALTVIIAKHHGNLPDFKPENKGTEFIKEILSEREFTKKLFPFLNKEINKNLPIDSYINHFEDFANNKSIQEFFNNANIQEHFLGRLSFDEECHKKPLEFYLNTQFAFASLLLADKADASDSNVLNEDKEKIKEFCQIYPKTLNDYVLKFKPTSELNRLRTEIREETVATIQPNLKEDKRVFELTAPTGSGKTIMLLSLASEIIKQKGEHRIMYALPFLSITEQVEKEVLEIFEDYKGKGFVQRIDSKAANQEFAELQEKLDNDPQEEDFNKLEALLFQEKTFAYPFIITTFVRFFETLLSNRNATLLKLPNFSKSIFLLDEIQSLPPRLYTFFVAYLTKFCKEFDSYAIISTATQPNFALPENENVKMFFDDYDKPTPLLDYEKYFESEVFNRYKIDHQKEGINIEQLAEKVIAENNSVLVILNTIDDSKDLFEILRDPLEEEEVYLLNTHFVPNDRKEKIRIAKDRLKKEQKVILISTQLIEAGVDISFPVLYRDFALVSSIIQSAGRCNRNGELKDKNQLGKVILFNLEKNRKSRAKLIYGKGKDKNILGFTKNALLKEKYQEKELLSVQKEFFGRVKDELNFGQHSQKKFKTEFDFVEDMKVCAFDKIGKFQLIDEREYGTEMRFYVSKDDYDDSFEELLNMNRELIEIKRQKGKKDWNAIKAKKSKIQDQLKKMANQIVQVRMKDKHNPPNFATEKDYYGLQHLHSDCYHFVTGVDLTGEDFMI